MDCSNSKIQRLGLGALNFLRPLVHKGLAAGLWLACAVSVGHVAHAADRTSNVEKFPLARPVHLRGTLWPEKHYGPPGYGEDKKNDKISTILALRLDVPIDLIDPQDGRRKSNYAPLNEVQVEFKTADFDKAADRAVKAGLHVEIEGVLEREGIHQFLEATLVASKLSVIP